jgi:hypothetical protein
MQAIIWDNNERLVNGVIKGRDGTYTALGYTRSKNFKTEKAAKRFLRVK